MAVMINISELKDALELTPSTQNIMLVGKHGIGKSEILTSYFKSKGMKVVTLFLGQMSDPGDIIGLPSKVEKKDADGNVTSQTDFTPPYWFPVDGKPIVLFLDELNRARPEILQTVMDLTLNRKLAGKALPEGSHVISAVNDGDEYQLTDLDPALVSRFNIYEFRPTVEEWLNWAASQGLDERVINFIQDNPTWLDGDSGDGKRDYRGLDKSADRRAWKNVSDIMLKVDTIKDSHKRIIAGVVGAGAAAAFIRSVQQHNAITGKQNEEIITSVLRNNIGVFSQYCWLDESLISRETGYSQHQVYECLTKLSSLHIVHYVPKKHASQVTFLQNRVPTRKIMLSKNIYEERKERYERQIRSMLAYIQNNSECKSRLLLRYFGEEFDKDCMLCNSCMQKYFPTPSAEEYQAIHDCVLQQVSKDTPFRLSDLKLSHFLNDLHINYVLQRMVDTKEIIRIRAFEYVLA